MAGKVLKSKVFEILTAVILRKLSKLLLSRVLQVMTLFSLTLLMIEVLTVFRFRQEFITLFFNSFPFPSAVHYALFYKQHQTQNGKKPSKANQHPEAELFLSENYSLSSSTLSFKNNRRY